MSNLTDTTLAERHLAATELLHGRKGAEFRDTDGPLLLSYVVWPADDDMPDGLLRSLSELDDEAERLAPLWRRLLAKAAA